MYRVEELSREEQTQILMGCSKEELVSMVIECNKHISPKVAECDVEYSTESINEFYKENYLGFDTIPTKVFSNKPILS
jgi:phosphosulfolactate synthase (CoM biosynthesis protein A)